MLTSKNNWQVSGFRTQPHLCDEGHRKVWVAQHGTGGQAAHVQTHETKLCRVTGTCQLSRLQQRRREHKGVSDK